MIFSHKVKYLREIDELVTMIKMRLNSQGVVKSHLFSLKSESFSHLKLDTNADISLFVPNP